VVIGASATTILLPWQLVGKKDGRRRADFNVP
jgi:hypothetical protein